MPETDSKGKDTYRLLSATLSPLGIHRSDNEAIMLLDAGRSAWNNTLFDIKIERQKKTLREVTMHIDEGMGVSVDLEYSTFHHAYVGTLSLSQGVVSEVMAFIRTNEALYRRNPGLHKAILDWWQHLWDGGKHEYGT